MDKQNDKGGEKLLLPMKTWQLWYMMIVIYVLYLLDFASRAVISPMFPLLKAEFLLSDAQLGWLATALLAMVGLLAIPLSYIHDVWSRGKMISIVSVVWSIASFFSGLATNFAQLISSRALMGIGEASFNSGGQALIMATIKKSRRSLMTGIWTTAAALGTFAGMMIGGAVAMKFGWRAAFIAVAIPGIIFGIMAWFIPDYKNPPRTAISGERKSAFVKMLKELFTNKSVITLSVSYAFFLIWFQSVFTWTPSYFVRYMGMDIAQAGLVVGSTALVMLIVSPFGGLIGDRISKKQPRNKILLCFVGVFISCIGQVTMVHFNLWPMVYVAVLGQSIFFAVMIIALQETVPSYLRASAYGFFMLATMVLGGLWGPALVGAISDASSLKVAFYILAGILAIALFGFIFAFKFYNADYKRSRELEQAIEQSE